MGGAMGRGAGLRALGRWAAIAGLAGVAASCGAVENLAPNVSDFHPLPSFKSVTPAVMTPYTRQLTPSGPVPPGDLVDGQGICAGGASAYGATDAPGSVPSRGVVLGMTECEVARALGQPQQVDVTPDPNGSRVVVLTYQGGDRPGIYRFVNGRLNTIDRGNEPPPPEVARKPAPKKPKPAAPPA
jgi:hypothetical protein